VDRLVYCFFLRLLTPSTSRLQYKTGSI
jgi:hypothetical protein